MTKLKEVNTYTLEELQKQNLKLLGLMIKPTHCIYNKIINYVRLKPQSKN